MNILNDNLTYCLEKKAYISKKSDVLRLIFVRSVKYKQYKRMVVTRMKKYKGTFTLSEGSVAILLGSHSQETALSKGLWRVAYVCVCFNTKLKLIM